MTNNRRLDCIPEDTLADIAGEQDPIAWTEPYWKGASAARRRSWTDQAEALELSQRAIAVWACQRGKKELNDAHPPYWLG